MVKARIIRFMTVVVAGIMVHAVAAKTLIEWDFSKGTQGWTGNQMVKPLRVTDEGIVVESEGNDPWIEGPGVDIPAGYVAKVIIRARTSADGYGQVFFGPSFTAERARNVLLDPDDQWHEYHVIVAGGLGPKTRFRFDPCTNVGQTIVKSIRIDLIAEAKPPVWNKPRRIATESASSACGTDRLGLRFSEDFWGSFSVLVNGRNMASGYSGEQVSVLVNDQIEHIPLEGIRAKVTKEGPVLETRVRFRDSGQANWQLSRRFEPMADGGAIKVTVSVAVDKDRGLLGMPWLTLLGGFGTYGTHKHQAVFAGLEYLGDEPSSSQADLTVSAHVRRIPDPIKITFPLMAIEHEGSYVGLIWEKSPLVAAGFDSPDTLFGSGAQVMWLSGPNVGPLRFENDLIGHSPMDVKAGQSLVINAWIIGGKGDSVVPAVQQYTSLCGFPELPHFEGGYAQATERLAHGWLDSGANCDFLFRHAVWGSSFGPGPAADAAMYMHWLAGTVNDAALAERLRQGVNTTLSKLSPGDLFNSGVSHVRLLTPSLLFGRVDELVQLRRREALAQLKRFDNQGRLIYEPVNGREDYGKTHFANHANGYGGVHLANILENAALCGDKDLTQSALALLDKQAALYANSVPRGGQTWEIPLHTPDIMASAHMTKAYVYGYLLSNKAEYLDEARYWAWTGVPFVYLVNPTDGPVGDYATIAVLGATSWVAPIWLGQPVQWCGLVYGASLDLLADYDPEGPWRRLSSGITITGMQMSWPESDTVRQGLLPDFYHLRRQVSDGPAINPGTVGSHLPEAFGQAPLYVLKKIKSRPWLLHAPCDISEIRETPQKVSFRSHGVGEDGYYLLLSGCRKEPEEITFSPQSSGSEKFSYQYYEPGFLVIQVKGDTTVTIETVK